MRMRRRLGIALAFAFVLLASSAYSGRELVAGQARGARRVLIMASREGRAEPLHVLLPDGPRAPGSVGVVIALHGRGEALRGPTRGALGWLDDYALERAFAAFARGRVSAAEANGMASDAQLRAMTRLLRDHPFRDLAVVMPYTPDLSAEEPGSPALAAYGAWLAQVALPELRRALPALTADPARTGIDGVSLGGMIAIDIGLRSPDVVGRVGGIQPAVRGRVEAYGPLATPATRCLRLSSSAQDPFLRATRALSAAWRARDVPHELVIYEGPHGYEFNRGPGSLELLRFHHACFSRRR
ncbi:MAG: hypothetical protein OHK0013_21030 [Sandaracinaceae bacterium]